MIAAGAPREKDPPTRLTAPNPDGAYCRPARCSDRSTSSIDVSSTYKYSQELNSLSQRLCLGEGHRTDLRLSVCNISSDHVQVVAGGFESLLGVMVRNKSGVIIKGCVALPAETIKDDQQTGMFLIDAGPHKIDDGDVVSRLASCTESVAEHEPQRGFKHCFIGLLEASLLVKSENFAGRDQLFIRAREEAFDLRPVSDVWF